MSIMISPSHAAVALLIVTALTGCGSATPSATVPNVVGQALDVAKGALVTAGFPAESQDLLRGRNPLLDSDWTVCTQTPGPVATAAGSTVDLGVVKKAETCPDTAASPTTAALPTRTHGARPAVESAKPRPAPPATSTAAAAAAPVRSGAFCDPPATGISDRDTAMVCARAADGRYRWKRA